MPTTRLEAFSDGIFAIAITLLVLEIHVPEGDGLLAQARGPLALLRGLRRELPDDRDHLGQPPLDVRAHPAPSTAPLLFLNLLLLLTVAFLPFPTALVAEHIREGTDEDVAAAVYAASLLVMGASFFATAVYAHRLHRLPPAVHARDRVAQRRRPGRAMRWRSGWRS